MIYRAVIIILTLSFICKTLEAIHILKGEKAKKQIPNTNEIYINKTSKTIEFVKFDNNKQPIVNNLDAQLMQWYQLKAPYGFKLIASTTDKLGYIHYRYKQTYQSYSIKNMVVNVHTKNGKVTSTNGEITNKLDDNHSYRLSFLNALDIAKTFIGATAYKWEIPQEEFHLSKSSKKKATSYFPESKLILIEDKLGVYQLCYEVNVFAHQPESRDLVYVNANNGKIEHTENLICSYNISTSIETKKSGDRTVITNDTIIENKYALLDLTRGRGIGIIDSRTLTLVADDDNIWPLAEYDNAERDYAALDCHWGATATYDYFLNFHNRNSFDNAGAPVECRVHYVYENGSTNNATWTGSYLSFGDGLSFANAFTALDIVAHEFTHGVTDFSANLLYEGESGALNESFSDIFGVAVEFYANTSDNSGNWLLGEDIGFVLRNLSNPNRKGHPDTYGSNDPFWIEIDGCWPGSENDLCGLHINSGVQNHWFYLLANGGSGTNHNGDNYNVNGIGIKKAAEIAYRNLTVYLTPKSRYSDAKRYAIEAAKDLFGECPASPELISTINAWYAVGLGKEYTEEDQLQTQVNLLSPNYYCSAPQTVSFFASSNYSNTTFTWNFDNAAITTGDTVTYTFNKPGSYNVSLKAKGCNASSIITETDLITIDTVAPCILTMPFNSRSIENVCSGTLYDVNGPGKSYSDLSDGTVTIVSLFNEPVNLLFTELAYEPGYDFLYIYDGPDTSNNLITTLNGYDLPDTISSTGNSITIRHFSDLYVVDDGFTLNWWSSSCDPNAIELCPQEQIFTDNAIALNGLVKAKSLILSNQIISSNVELEYLAGDSISLINNFEVMKDGNFSAIIESCEP